MFPPFLFVDDLDLTGDAVLHDHAVVQILDDHPGQDIQAVTLQNLLLGLIGGSVLLRHYDAPQTTPALNAAHSAKP